MEQEGIPQEEFVFVDYYMDAGSPYTCNEWGNVGIQGSPPIVDGGEFPYANQGNNPDSLYAMFYGEYTEGGSLPKMVIIDREGRFIDETSGLGTHSDTTWNKIEGLVLNTWNWCEVMGCTNPTATNYNPDAEIDDGSCEYFEPGAGGPEGYYEPPVGGCEPDEVNLWSECYNIIETTELNLGSSGLTGEIPPEIGQLTNLTRLYLQYNNQLTGEIPPEIGDLTNLNYLYLQYNQLGCKTIEAPEQPWGASTCIDWCDGTNGCSGEIPPEIGNLTNLNRLNLSNNQLTGEIPSEIGNLINLDDLWLNNNQLTGVIPEEICNQGDSTPSLWNNQLCPPYPECIPEDHIGYQDTSNCNGRLGGRQQSINEKQNFIDDILNLQNE